MYSIQDKKVVTIINTVNLVGYLSGNCECKGCIYNDGSGICHCDDDEFKAAILDLIYENIKLNVLSTKVDFNCYMAKPEDGFCMCGEKLATYTEKYEYMGREVYEITKGCPNCEGV